MRNRYNQSNGVSPSAPPLCLSTSPPASTPTTRSYHLSCHAPSPPPSSGHPKSLFSFSFFFWRWEIEICMMAWALPWIAIFLLNWYADLRWVLGQLFGCRKVFSRIFFFYFLVDCSRLCTMFCTFWFSSKPKRTNQPKLVSRFRFDFAFHLGSGQFLSPSDEWVFGNSVRSVRPDGQPLPLRTPMFVITWKRHRKRRHWRQPRTDPVCSFVDKCVSVSIQHTIHGLEHELLWILCEVYKCILNITKKKTFSIILYS